MKIRARRLMLNEAPVELKIDRNQPVSVNYETILNQQFSAWLEKLKIVLCLLWIQKPPVSIIWLQIWLALASPSSPAVLPIFPLVMII